VLRAAILAAAWIFHFPILFQEQEILLRKTLHCLSTTIASLWLLDLVSHVGECRSASNNDWALGQNQTDQSRISFHRLNGTVWSTPDPQAERSCLTEISIAQKTWKTPFKPRIRVNGRMQEMFQRRNTRVFFLFGGV